MKRKQKKYYSLLIVLFLCLGLGYAALTTDLSINGISHVAQSNWSIHFDNIQEDSSSSATINQAAEITGDTSLSYDITLAKPGDYYEFTVDVVNDGTIDGMISSVSSKLNNVEITTLPNYLEYSVTYDDDIPIAPNHLLNAGDTETYKIHVGYKKDITEEDLPGDTTTLHLVFDTPFEQPDEDAIPRPHLQMLQPTSKTDTSAFRSSTYKTNIVTINLDDEINPPSNVIESWDIGLNQNGDVMAYITQNANDNTKYDLFIQGDGALYANPDSSYLFHGLTGVNAINNLEVLNVSKAIDLSYMFSNLGFYSTTFTLNLGDNFDTSRATNMMGMFYYTGSHSTYFTLDLGDNFDTSHVTNMYTMFRGTGSNSSVFTLDLGDKFDTAKVTNMSYLFDSAGQSSTVFTLDLGNKFDTSNVTNMSHMFASTGYSNTTFTLNLGEKFNTSKVTNMSLMFWCTGRNSSSFTLDLGDKFDTSIVTNMLQMFYYTGYSSQIFTLNFGNKFDTSQVENMDHMFSYIGHGNSLLELDLSNFTFNASLHEQVFLGFMNSQKIYVKNAADQSWVISHGGSSNLSTTNVLIKSS